MCGWNCRHSFFPYFEGAGHAYTSDQLRSYEDKNISYNGKMYTEYEASQMQRHNERQIRRWKREYAAMEAAGLDTTEAAVKLHSWRERQRDFLEQTGLKRQSERERLVLFDERMYEQNEKSFFAGIGSPETDLEYINSPAYKKKFSTASDNPILNDALYRYSKAAITHQSKKFTEDLFVLDKSGNLIGHTSAKEAYQTEYNAKLKKTVEIAEPYSLVSIHNHGTNVPPSGADLVSAGSKRYAFGIVACHNGKVYYYSSANARPFLPGVIDDAVDKFLTKQYDLSVEQAFERALDDAANAYGIEWRELK